MLLSIKDLSVQLGGRTILHGVSLDASRGEWIGVIGPNGSGKTTLLKAISGFLEHNGSIEIDGRPVSSWNRRKLAKVIAFVRQTHGLTFEFEVRDLVLMGKTPHKSWLEPTTQRDLRELQAALDQVGLSDFGDRNIFSLSGGELQRVFLAQALVQNAELLLLDEPTSHLDVFHQYDLLEHVRRMIEAGRSAIAVFHDLGQAARYCDNVLVLHEGAQVAFAPPGEVLNSDLIRRVFKMDAAVTSTEGIAGITYLRPAN
ncbi:MAG: ABC transporter ATP-binding protein [Rhodothermia bacterium]